jgi:GR25 family glycosyltransferase involved in LPS biosynthesis
MLPAYTNIPAFCINLDYRADRWSSVLQQFMRLNWAVTRWPALQVKNTDGSTLSAGAAGCLASHRGVWQHVIANALPVVAVFEDDAVFPTDFAEVFAVIRKELPADWQLLHLHSMAAHGAAHISPHILKYNGQSGWGSHGYIITNSGCQTALEINDPHAPVDDLLTRSMFQAGATPYGIIDKYTLCFQSGQDSDIPATQAVGHWRALRDSHWR